MKAVFMLEHGNTEVLQYGDVPEPVIDENEVKIRVKACGINRLDIFTEHIFGVVSTFFIFQYVSVSISI